MLFIFDRMGVHKSIRIAIALLNQKAHNGTEKLKNLLLSSSRGDLDGITSVYLPAPNNSCSGVRIFRAEKYIKATKGITKLTATYQGIPA